MHMSTTALTAGTSDADRRRIIESAFAVVVDGVPDLPPTHRGKVRDVYVRGDELLLVATDRVSAFDVVLGTIPLKGQLLTEQSVYWLQRAAEVAPTHLIERLGPAVLRCKKAQAFPVELVVRGHLAGSLLREAPDQRGRAYGLTLDPAQTAWSAFAEPIITPTTKEAVGVHDEPCSLDDLVSSGRMTAAQVTRACEIARALFALGQRHADDQGLILVDTKYELGLIDGEICIIDEVHTADSSRFWVKASYGSRVAAGEAPEMLDKENLRRWLLAQGFSGHGTPPPLSDAIRSDLAAHYWDLTERVLGHRVLPELTAPSALRTAVQAFLSRVGQ